MKANLSRSYKRAKLAELKSAGMSLEVTMSALGRLLDLPDQNSTTNIAKMSMET